MPNAPQDGPAPIIRAYRKRTAAELDALATITPDDIADAQATADRDAPMLLRRALRATVAPDA